MKQFLKVTLVTFGSIALLWPGVGAALTNDQVRVLESGIYYFNTEAAGCSVELSVSLSGNDHEQQAYNFFVKNGLSAVQSAGVVGNLMWESHLDPTVTNSNGGAHGLAQWTPSSGRLQKLQDYAKQNNADADDFLLQLNFVWYELTQGSYQKAGNNLKAAADLAGANRVIFSEYEGPGDDTEPDRLKNATTVYDSYGSSAVGSASGFDSCASVGPGQNTQYVDGFTVYSQYDPAWADKPYASSTIAESGCGPAAMAMIITTLKGQSVTPDVTAAYAASQNLYIPGIGSSWGISEVLAKHWGLKPSLVGDDKAAITAALQSGALVIASGKGALPFSPSGHFIVIRGATASGKWLIGDSGHNDTSTKEWSPDVILSGIQNNNGGGSIYAISK